MIRLRTTADRTGHNPRSKEQLGVGHSRIRTLLAIAKRRTAGLGYHTNGTRRCRTRFWYSVYPARSLARRRSSSKSRHIRNGIMAAIGTSPQYEPSASGVPTRYSDPLAYIGWRTIAYGPVEMTV